MFVGHDAWLQRPRVRLWGTLLTGTIAMAIGASTPPSMAAASAAEIDKDVYMREAYGLRSDRAYVDELRNSSRDVGTAEFGMPLTKAESDELDLHGRERFEAAVAVDLVPFLQTLPAYAGEWIDQKDGGRLVVMLTKRQDDVIGRVRDRMPKPSRGVRFEVVTSTWEELEGALDRAPSVAKSIEPSAEYSIGEINTQKNRLDIRFKTGASSLAEKEAALEAALGVKVDVGWSPRTKQMENCGQGQDEVTSCWDPLRAGVRIHWRSYNDPWICTMGFHILKGGDQQWLTAGHCIKVPGTSKEMYHNRYFHNPGGDPDTTKKIGNQQDSLYNSTDKIDAARVAHYYGAAETSARIWGTTPTFFTGDAGAAVVNTRVWARGATSTEDGLGAQDGLIKSASANWFSETQDIVVKGATMGAYNPRGGDSGGPIYLKGGVFNGVQTYVPIGIINDDVLPEDNEPGKCAFAKVTTVLNQFGASIYTGSN